MGQPPFSSKITTSMTLKDRQENDAQPNEHKEKHQ
jgi:hypothetical protein